MSFKHVYMGILTAAILAGGSVQSQIVGNPAGSQGQKEWSVSVSGSFLTQDIGAETNKSTRWLLKSTYGIVPWLDFVATLGAADLRIDSPTSNAQDLESKRHFAYGAGLNLTLKKETVVQPLGIFAGGHILRFPAEGTFQQTVSGTNVIYLYREYRMEYDWRETQFFGGLSYRIGQLRLYGCGVGWSLNRIEKKMEYHFESPDDKDFIAEVKSESQTDWLVGGLIGLEVVFPKTRHALTLEGLFYDTENFVVMVGIGQTGIVHSGW